MELLSATLKHGWGSPVEYLPDGGIKTAPRCDEPVECRRSPLWWQEKGLSFTASGYGSRIPTEYMIKVGSRWRRVYCRIYSNSGTLFIGRGESRVVVDIERSEG